MTKQCKSHKFLATEGEIRCKALNCTSNQWHLQCFSVFHRTLFHRKACDEAPFRHKTFKNNPAKFLHFCNQCSFSSSFLSVLDNAKRGKGKLVGRRRKRYFQSSENTMGAVGKVSWSSLSLYFGFLCSMLKFVFLPFQFWT